MLTIIIVTIVEGQNVSFTGIRNPVGLIHGQLAPRYLKVTDYDLYGKEYVYGGQNDTTKGWTVHGYADPQLYLNLQSHYLITGISFRTCTGNQCSMPTVFQATMWNNSIDWIHLRYKTEDISSVSGFILLNILLVCTIFLVGMEGLNGTVVLELLKSISTNCASDNVDVLFSSAEFN